MSTVERGVEPGAQRSLNLLAAELADLARRISEHRAFLAGLNDRMLRRAGRQRTRCE